MTALWNLETVIFREGSIFDIAAGFIQSCFIFLIIRITDTFEKEQRKYISFKVGGIYRATQDIRGGPKPIGKTVIVGAVFFTGRLCHMPYVVK